MLNMMFGRRLNILRSEYIIMNYLILTIAIQMYYIVFNIPMYLMDPNEQNCN